MNPLDAALGYAAKGWRVLPLHTPDPDHPTGCSCHRMKCVEERSQGKHPRIMGWDTKATTDQDQIRKWWDRWPDANVGIATGNGLAVLDVDPRNDGDHTLQKLEEEHGELLTLTARTGGGGLHFYLQGDLPSRGGFLPGLDLQGAGKLVVAPPSRHVSGGCYSFTDPEESPRVPPPWLAALLANGSPPNGPAPKVEGRIPDGERDNTLASLAGTMRRRGMEEPEILAALMEANRRRCDPPLSEDQVRKIAASVARYDPAPETGGSSDFSTHGKVPDEDQNLDGKPKLPAPMGVSDLLAVEEPDEEMLVHGILPAGGNVLVAGYPKTFKTLFLLDLGVSLASGTPFLGKFEVPEKRRVGIVLMEDQAHRVRRRLQRICEGKGTSLEELEGWLYLWFRPPLRLNDQTAVELADYVADLDLDFLGVDSWAYVASGDSNSADEVTPQLMALTYARVKRPGLTVQLTHHARKDHGKKDAGSRLTDEIRNSGAFGAWFDAGMVLSRKDETSPVTVRTELRDFPTPESFAFQVEDEVPAYPGNEWNPQGWLRLVVSKYRPELLDRMAAAQNLVPAVREFLTMNPGCSKRAIRNGVTGRNPDIDGALDLLEEEGEVEIIESPGPGKPSQIRLQEGSE